MGGKRYRVRIKGPFGPFDGMDGDEIAEALMREMDEVREEEWELTEDEAVHFVNDDGYVYVMTVWRKGKPELLFTQKEIWEDPEGFARILQDPNLSPEQKVAQIKEAIRRRSP